MWLLYQAAMAGAMLAAAPVLLIRRGRHYLPTLRGRLGGFDEQTPRHTGGLWIHAVSVGEVAVAATLVRALPAELPLVVTTVTPTGQARARAAFARRGASITYLPFDLGFAVDRFLRRFAPRALILVEGDYWPLVLQRTRRHGLPVAVINGRMGATSVRRRRTLARRFPRLFRGLGLSSVDRFGVQTEGDGRRLAELGIADTRIAVTGNLKYESTKPAALPGLEEALQSLAGTRTLLIAGSTMQDEDALVLDAFAQVSGAGFLLVLVPRHPERWDEAERLCAARGLRCLRRSALVDDDASDHRTAAETDRPDVVLLDSMGELAALYRIADAAFIGGTLVPTGGHNPLEPARFGVPIVVGPSMFNFQEMADAFAAAGAWNQVADANGLAACWQAWRTDPHQARAVGERAAALLEANRGALGRTLDMLGPLLRNAFPDTDRCAAGADAPDIAPQPEPAS